MQAPIAPPDGRGPCRQGRAVSPSASALAEGGAGGRGEAAGVADLARGLVQQRPLVLQDEDRVADGLGTTERALQRRVGGDQEHAALRVDLGGEEVTEEVLEAGTKDTAGILQKRMAAGTLTKATKGEAVDEIAEALIARGFKDDIAREMAQSAVNRELKQQSIDAAAGYFGKRALQGGIIAGVGYALWNFGAGAIGAVGDIFGTAGEEFVTNTYEWMADNPMIAAAGAGIGLLLVGGLLISLIAPLLVGAGAKKAVTKDKDDDKEEDDSSDEDGE